jgi:hypothetical protein
VTSQVNPSLAQNRRVAGMVDVEERKDPHLAFSLLLLLLLPAQFLFHSFYSFFLFPSDFFAF